MMLFLSLLLASIVAAGLLVWPLLRPAAERGVARPPADWRMALALGFAVPAVAFALYAGSGRPFAWFGDQAEQQAQADSLSRIQSSIDDLAARLRATPDDLEGWLLLARSYQGIGRMGESLEAYARAVALAPSDADLMVEYANTLGRQQGRSLAGQPTAWIERALAIQPDNLNALALAGAAALQQGEPARAREYWVRLRDLTPADSPDRPRVDALLARIDGDVGMMALPADHPVMTAEGAGSAPAAATAMVRGLVRISPALADRVSPGDTLFVFARALEGPPLPIAAVRKSAAGWPVHFVLDDASSMMQGRALSDFEAVQLVARVSHSGSPEAQAGDLEGRLAPVAVGADQLEIILDRVVENR